MRGHLTFNYQLWAQDLCRDHLWFYSSRTTGRAFNLRVLCKDVGIGFRAGAEALGLGFGALS